MPSAIESLRNQVMSTRAVMVNSLNSVATQRDTTISSIKASMGQDGGGAQNGILPNIQSIRSRFMAPTGQQAAGGEQKGILGGILGGKGILGTLSEGNGAQQEGGLLGRIKSVRSNLFKDTPPTAGLSGVPQNSSFLNAPPERTGATVTPTPMGAIPTDANVTHLQQKGAATTSLGLIEVD